MYKIIISEVIIYKIEQKGRTITKKRFVKIKEIYNINKKDLSERVIALKKLYRDFKYIIDFEEQ